MTRHPTLLRPHAAPGTTVPADLHEGLTPLSLIEAEAKWKPVRDNVIVAMKAHGKPANRFPEHHNWDWAAKAGRLKFLTCRAFGVECDGEYQGLMMVDLSRAFARLPPDSKKPLVYVDFLETAPWNSMLFTDKPKYGGVGSVLLRAAVQVSIDEGFRGRIGLHSLPQAVEFYAWRCGMIDCGPDPSYYNLPYLEMNQQIAEAFLRGKTKPTPTQQAT